MAARWWLLLVVAIALSIATVEVVGRIARKPATPTSRTPQPIGQKTPPIAPNPNGPPHVYGRVVALCIGIEKYEYLQEARYAENDARVVSQSLQTNYRFSAECLTGKNATRKGIWNRLHQLGKELGPNDVLIVFFAGHGQVINLPSLGRTGFLLPYDADLDLGDHRDLKKWKNMAIEMQDLLDMLRDQEKMRAQHVLLAVDACCSGFLTRRGNFEERLDLQKLLASRSRTVLAATTDRQAARPDGKRQHGVFTAALLDAINTNDAASVTDVFLEVRKRVARFSEGTMTPQMSHVGDGDGEFVFLPITIPADDIRITMEEAKARIPLRQNSPFRGLLKRTQDRANVQITIKDVIEAFESEEYRYSLNPTEQASAWEEKLKRFQQNAAMGDVMSMIALHYCEARGLGIDPNPAGAYRWAKLAFETGHPGGKHVLGRSLAYKIGVPLNTLAGLKLIHEAAEEGFPISLLQKGYDLAKNGEFEKAERAWKTAATFGVNTANYYLAAYYEGLDPDGKSIPNMRLDRQAALAYLMPAARSGLAKAQSNLAALLLDIDLNNNRDEAARWLERAAASGEAFSQSVLAQELAPKLWVHTQRQTLLDLRLTENVEKAVRWAQLAADQDDPVGNVVLACLYWKGSERCPQNYDRAIEHCNKAAKRNHYAAFILQSKWHQEGIVLPKDRPKALSLAERAAGLNKKEGNDWLMQLRALGH